MLSYWRGKKTGPVFVKDKETENTFMYRLSNLLKYSKKKFDEEKDRHSAVEAKLKTVRDERIKKNGSTKKTA